MRLEYHKGNNLLFDDQKFRTNVIIGVNKFVFCNINISLLNLVKYSGYLRINSVIEEFMISKKFKFFSLSFLISSMHFHKCCLLIDYFQN